MKLACNASNDLFKLIVAEKVKVDYIKCHLDQSMDSLPRHYIVYGDLMVHGLGEDIPNSITSDLSKVPWKRLNKHIDGSRSPHYGIHLRSELSDFKNERDANKWKSKTIKNINLWKDNIHAEIILENTPFNVNNKDSMLVDLVKPEIIDEICEATNSGLILDIAHAHVTSDYLGMNRYDYLSSLPLDRVKELHVVGTITVNNIRRDVHESLTNEDYEVIRWLLPQLPQLNVITLEYGGVTDQYKDKTDRQKLYEQLTTLRILIEE